MQAFWSRGKNCAVLVDPVIASRGEGYADEVFGFSQLPPRVDFICLTHNHQDHVNLETLLQLRYKTDQVLVLKNNGGTLADPSIRLLLKQLGFSVREVDDLEEIPLPGGRITSIPFFGEHGDLNIRSKTAWLIEIDGKKCFFGADSANPDISLYEHLREVLSDLDVFAIGMECVGAPYTWLYGALHTVVVPKFIKESRRLNGSDSGQAVSIIKLFTSALTFTGELLCNSNDSSCKPYMSLHNRISVFRAERGMSRRQLAEAVGVNHQTIGYLERGDYKPSLELALKIARHFGVAVEMVFSLDRFAMTFGRKGEGDDA